MESTYSPHAKEVKVMRKTCCLSAARNCVTFTTYSNLVWTLEPLNPLPMDVSDTIFENVFGQKCWNQPPFSYVRPTSIFAIVLHFQAPKSAFYIWAMFILQPKLIPWKYWGIYVCVCGTHSCSCSSTSLSLKSVPSQLMWKEAAQPPSIYVLQAKTDQKGSRKWGKWKRNTF